MTEKMRATTMQQKFGFKDDELSTPKHDAIMCWLDGEAENIAKEIISAKAPNRGESENKALENIKKHAPKLINTWSGLGEPPPPKVIEVVRVWESPVVAPNKFMVGFVDMEAIVSFEKSCICCYTPYYSRPEEYSTPHWEAEQDRVSIIFEVKTAIRSAGELIRQIRMYQQYKYGVYVVVSPDNRFESILNGQGIKHIQCPSNL